MHVDFQNKSDQLLQVKASVKINIGINSLTEYLYKICGITFQA